MPDIPHETIALASQTDARETMTKRAVLSSIVGSALEWLEFAAYGAVAATVLPKLFFPSDDPRTATLAAFATFTVGFIARPLGGVVFGLIGDRIGRKNTLMATFVLMGLASVSIGLLPSYAAIGVWAPALLVMLRFLQGFALGGEVTGSQILTMEHAPVRRRGFYSSFIAMGSPLAQVLANGILFVLTASMTEDQFNSVGWRIPFLISFLLIALGIYIRRHVEEPQAFNEGHKEKQQQGGAGEVVGTIIRLAIAWSGLSVAYFIAAVFALSYITNQLGVSKQAAFAVLICGHIFSMFMMAIGGNLSDRIGRRKTMLIGMSCLVVAMMAFFPLLHTGNIVIIGIAIAGLLGLMQFHAGVQPAFFAEMFPARNRYIGSALSYNIGNLVGSCAPFAAALLVDFGNGSSWIVVAVATGIALLSLLAVLCCRETLKEGDAL